MSDSTVNSNGTTLGDPHGARGSDALVLLVDDYQDCREMYGASLELAGFRVIKARDAFEALQLARRTSPDVILMDLGLPGIDGCEATRLLKEDPRTSSIPVVALTAQAVPAAGSLLAMGFEEVITKPCLPDTLADHVTRLLNGRDVLATGREDRPAVA